MLKKRMITGLILTVLALWIILAWPLWTFVLLTALIFSWAGWEWCKLRHWLSNNLAFGFMTGLWLLFLITHFLDVYFILSIAFFGWLLAAGLLLFYPRYLPHWFSKHWAGFVIGYLLFVPSWLALIEAFRLGRVYLLFGLLLIWSADTGAYFVGRQWGKHYLAPRISPGKTIEGALGGIILALLIALGVLFFWHTPFTRWLDWLGLSMIVVIASMIGDLFESMAKRIAAVKDTGHLLPGHGGVLDRMDSTLCAFPVYVLGIWILHL